MLFQKSGPACQRDAGSDRQLSTDVFYHVHDKDATVGHGTERARGHAM